MSGIMMTGLDVMMFFAFHDMPVTLFMKMALMMVAAAVTVSAFIANMCTDFCLGISKGSAKKHSGNSDKQQNVFFHHNAPVIMLV